VVTRFEATNESAEVVRADRSEIWDALTDPQLLTELTPLLRRIDADGERWVWHMMGISALGVEVAPSFTETMDFTPEQRIDFAHTPDGRHERAGADGVYLLSDVDVGTRLEISITIHVELPLPRVSRAAVQGVMEQSMQRTGDRFARNLLDHLGVRAA
jgi:carbon monoxide dehydrogenase subunit G